MALYATCRGVLYVPFDEDFGYVTVEAFLSRKPVVTASDSGGPLEFVEDGASGFVAAPEPTGARRRDRPPVAAAREPSCARWATPPPRAWLRSTGTPWWID